MDDGHVHTWRSVGGQPVACVACGELWPGDPDWPPEPFERLEGQGDHVPWSRRVAAMVSELS